MPAQFRPRRGLSGSAESTRGPRRQRRNQRLTPDQNRCRGARPPHPPSNACALLSGNHRLRGLYLLGPARRPESLLQGAARALLSGNHRLRGLYLLTAARRPASPLARFPRRTTAASRRNARPDGAGRHRRHAPRRQPPSTAGATRMHSPKTTSRNTPGHPTRPSRAPLPPPARTSSTHARSTDLFQYTSFARTPPCLY